MATIGAAELFCSRMVNTVAAESWALEGSIGVLHFSAEFQTPVAAIRLAAMETVYCHFLLRFRGVAVSLPDFHHTMNSAPHSDTGFL